MPLSQSCGTATLADPADELRKKLAHLQDLPACFTVIREAIAASEDPKVTNARLQRILARDPGATADILRLANSPYFGLGYQVGSVSMAITIIGYLRLGVLLRHLLVSRLVDTLAVKGARVIHTRDVARAAAVASQLLGEAAGRSDMEELMIAGLLHNIGELALIAEFPEESARAYESSNSMTQREAELAVFGATSSMVNGWLLSAWRFPEILINAAHHWDTPLNPSLSAPQRRFVGTVHAGVKLGRRYIAKWEWDADDLPVRKPLLDALNLTHEHLEFAYEQIGPRLEKLKHSLL